MLRLATGGHHGNIDDICLVGCCSARGGAVSDRPEFTMWVTSPGEKPQESGGSAVVSLQNLGFASCAEPRTKDLGKASFIAITCQLCPVTPRREAWGSGPVSRLGMVGG